MPALPVRAEPRLRLRHADTFAENSAPGDVLLVLGSPWSHPDYAALVSEQRERGLRFALLVYDLIPIRRPEWCDRGLVRLFRDWFRTVLPLCDVVFAISQATAADVERYARDTRITLPAQVQAIPIGTGFGVPPPPSALSAKHALPKAGSYALFVSTIEARKNHALLFRIWRQLLEDMKPEEVPTLVFAGRVGWMVGDLMHQIANTDHLNGKLVVIEDPTDTELAALYGGCLFTLFPSLYEGWGSASYREPGVRQAVHHLQPDISPGSRWRARAKCSTRTICTMLIRSSGKRSRIAQTSHSGRPGYGGSSDLSRGQPQWMPSWLDCGSRPTTPRLHVTEHA